MNRQFMVIGVGITVVLLTVLAGPAARGETGLERPGAYYWGDSGSATVANGVITSSDLTSLRVVLLGASASYDGVVPPSPLVQDISGDGELTSVDLIYMSCWIMDFYYTGETGRPKEVVLLTPNPTVTTGDSTPLEILLLNDATATGGPNPRLGFGVIFAVTGGCQTGVLIEGLDPTPINGNGRNQIVTETKAFGYTDLEGVATVKARNTLGACSGASTEVTAYVPGDAEAGIDGSRFPNPLYAATPIVIDWQ